MTNDFYTNVKVIGNKIAYRGIENGRRVRSKIDYYPSLFIHSDNPTQFTTISGEFVEEIRPGTMKECRDFCRQYEDIQDFKIYGNQRYEYAFISDKFGPRDPIPYDLSFIKVCNIDIEVGSENGFPEPETAYEPLTAITYKMGSKFMVFGCGEFKNTREDVEYIKCSNEIDLINMFLNQWGLDYPDIITGWNVKFFDIPYLVNRITRVMGEEFAKRLSPWNSYYEREVYYQNRQQQVYIIAGIAILDYLELYRSFHPGGQAKEQYSLNFICSEEIGEKKISYEEYGNLFRLYKDNYQKFIEYNIHDVELVERLDAKLKLVEVAIIIAYTCRCNFDDVFTQVTMWDSLFYNRLRSKQIVVPPNKKSTKKQDYEGVYVKEPIPGFYKYIASFDLDSLYPHLIMQQNISPDTIIEPGNYVEGMASFLDRGISVEKLLNRTINTVPLKAWNATVTPNGQLFRLDQKGFLVEMMQEIYDDRKVFKKKAIEAKKQIEVIKKRIAEEGETAELKEEMTKYKNDAAHYNNMQLAMKLTLNSAYGTLGSEYFRWFDVRQAEAITTSGKLAIQWIAIKINKYLNNVLGTKKDYIIASDTDSIYLSLDELVQQTFGSETTDTKRIIDFMDKVCEIKLQPFIDKSYNELAKYLNSLEQKMHMKREVLADKGFWTAKKRYALNVWNSEGVAYDPPEVKISGLEMVKSSTPGVCKVKLKKAVELILRGNNDDVIKFISEFKKEFKTLPVHEIASPRGVSGIKFYKENSQKGYKKGTPMHVRGSIVYNNFLEQNDLTKKYQTIKEGEKIKYIYLKEPNMIGENIIAFPQVLPAEFNIEKFVDYNTQFEKTFLNPLTIILDCIGWKASRGSSLSAFFS